MLRKLKKIQNLGKYLLLFSLFVQDNSKEVTKIIKRIIALFKQILKTQDHKNEFIWSFIIIFYCLPFGFICKISVICDIVIISKIDK